MPKKPTPLLERFFLRFTASSDESCWEWTGTKRHFGHGRLRESGAGSRELCASRLSYETFVGPVPAGMFVCHKCDNPGCVNPSHLYAGTQADNMRDKRVRNRQKGSRCHAAILTEPQAKLIKAFLGRHTPGQGKAGGQCSFLGRWFGVTNCAISDINRGRSWTHV